MPQDLLHAQLTCAPANQLAPGMRRSAAAQRCAAWALQIEVVPDALPERIGSVTDHSQSRLVVVKLKRMRGGSSPGTQPDLLELALARARSLEIGMLQGLPPQALPANLKVLETTPDA
jgi:hypothetical protein